VFRYLRDTAISTHHATSKGGKSMNPIILINIVLIYAGYHYAKDIGKFLWRIEVKA